jgi:tetratricopeptide (TPR) repeat protein
MRARTSRALALLAGLMLGAACASGPGREAPAETATDPGIAPLVERAEAHRTRAEHDAALELYREALERTPWNDRLREALATTHAERAAARRERGELSSAEADLRAAREISPGDPNLARNLAVVLVERAAREFDLEEAARLRQEAHALAPELADAYPERDARSERRLDLAQELLERDQLDAGLESLERLHSEQPGERSVAHLLAQGYVKRAESYSERRNFPAAGEDLDRAVALYTATFPRCRLPECRLEELETAHWNRVVAWLNAGEAEPARRALSEADAQGFRFPDLMRALEELPRQGSR